MVMNHSEQQTGDIGKVVEQLEKLLLRRLLQTLRDLNYEYEPLRSVPATKRESEPPF